MGHLDNANSGIKRPGLGRFADAETVYEIDGGGGGYTPVTPQYNSEGGGIVDVSYEEVPSTTPKSVDEATSAPLPIFNFSTSTSSCTDCNTVATKSATVTPLPAAPSTFNWLLLLGIATVGYIAYKSETKPGLAGPLEPQPAVEPKTMGRPPRPRPARSTVHVKELVID